MDQSGLLCSCWAGT